MSVSTGIKGVFGVRPVKPIVGLPPGRARLRLRHGEYAKVVVKDTVGIRSFWIEDMGDEWMAFESAGANVTVQQQETK